MNRSPSLLSWPLFSYIRWLAALDLEIRPCQSRKRRKVTCWTYFWRVCDCSLNMKPMLQRNVAWAAFLKWWQTSGLTVLHLFVRLLFTLPPLAAFTAGPMRYLCRPAAEAENPEHRRNAQSNARPHRGSQSRRAFKTQEQASTQWSSDRDA